MRRGLSYLYNVLIQDQNRFKMHMNDHIMKEFRIKSLDEFIHSNQHFIRDFQNFMHHVMYSTNT